MKKKIYSILALLTIVSTAFAQDSFFIRDTEIPQNGEADLVVEFSFPEENYCSGYQFNIQLPDGIEPVFDGTKIVHTDGDCYDGSASVNMSDGLIKVACFFTDSEPLVGIEGILLNVRIRATESLSNGNKLVGNLLDCKRATPDGESVKIEESTFNITVGEPADPRTVLDETSTNAPEAATGVDVRVRRTIKAGQWSTICLPFAMTGEQCKEAFGSDVQMAEFTGWATTDYDEDDNPSAIKVTFANVTAIAANTPYIIKVSEPVTEFTADGVTIEPEEEPSVTVGKRSKGTLGTFTGSYVPTTIDEQCLFLSDNQFWYSTGKTQMKGFRAYFYFLDVLGSYYEDAASKNIVMVFDGTATGIKRREAPNAVGEEQWYNLAGQRVAAPQKGIYIKNGKKVVK